MKYLFLIVALSLLGIFLFFPNPVSEMVSRPAGKTVHTESVRDQESDTLDETIVSPYRTIKEASDQPETPRVDGNGIRLFPENMDLSYPNSKGHIPGRPTGDEPKDPEQWDVVLTPQKGDNWSYISKAFKENKNIYFDKGVYHVNVVPRVKGVGTTTANVEELISIPSNSFIKFHPDAVISINPNNYGQKGSTAYGIFYLFHVKNATILNPRIKGDKYNKPKDYKPTGTEEWAAGIIIKGGSDNIQILNPHITEMWGDGISDDHQQSQVPSNITISNAFLYDNGRNDLSITKGHDYNIVGGVYEKADRTNPQASIDVETAQKKYQPDNLHFKNLTLRGSKHGLILFDHTKRVLAENINIAKCPSNSILVRNNTGNQALRNVNISNSGRIFLYNISNDVVLDNVSMRHVSDGVLIQKHKSGDIVISNSEIIGGKHYQISIAGNNEGSNIKILNTTLRDGRTGQAFYVTDNKASIYIENSKFINTKGFRILDFQKKFSMINTTFRDFKRRSVKDNFFLEIRVKKGDRFKMKNVTLNGKKLEDSDFTALKDTIVKY